MSVSVKVSNHLKKQAERNEAIMGNKPLKEWIGKKEQEIFELQQLVNQLVQLEALIPNLSYSVDRWKTFRLHSPEVNAQAEEVDIRHACGCCGDSPIQARPYIEKNGQRVYTVPEVFIIREKGYCCEHPYPGWRTTMLEAGISMKVIERVEAFFETHKPNDCRNEEDELI